MHRGHLSLLLTIAVVLGTPGLGIAQTPSVAPTPVVSYDTPAHVSFIDGAAVLEREGRAEELTAGVSLLQGDRIRTSTGRAEILFPDGSALYLDGYTLVEFLSDSLVRASTGRLTIVLAGAADTQREVRYQIDTPGGVVRVLTPGEFRVALLDSAGGRGREVVLEVVRGEAELSTERGAVPVRAGQRSVARDGAAPSFPLAFNSARLDAFDVWTTERLDARLGTRSTQYLPEPVQTYAGTFDRYGSWQYDAPYGYVWYPRASVGWRPYVNGYWRHSGLWGWTWVAHDPWGWPTHHFGRWGVSRVGAWFWIPSHRWAPAWVSWGYSPGYVAWCPLGYDNRPIFSFVNFNVVNYHEPFRAWNVMRHHDFGRVHRVNTLLVDSRSFGRGRGDRPHFVERPIGPVVQHAGLNPTGPVRAPSRGALGYAVPRSSNPGRGTLSSVEGRGGRRDARPPVNQGPAPAPPSRSFSIMGPGGGERRTSTRSTGSGSTVSTVEPTAGARSSAPQANDDGRPSVSPGGAVPRPSSPARDSQSTVEGRRWPAPERANRGGPIQGPRPSSTVERPEYGGGRPPQREIAPPARERGEGRYERAPRREPEGPRAAPPESTGAGRPDRAERRGPDRAPSAPDRGGAGAREAPQRRPPSAERPAPPPRGEGRPPASGGGGARERSGARPRGGG